ncbi:MAG TPA: hypothetical protein VFW73_06890 [Lacipirellulaceae bacterium]|nr:hypothetical protein [Lacipirellulaceae bacterium]
MKKYLLIVAFATAIASPALAQSPPYRISDDGAYAAVPGGNDAVFDNEIVGSDPDANIRLQLMRDAQSKHF